MTNIERLFYDLETNDIIKGHYIPEIIEIGVTDNKNNIFHSFVFTN